MSDLDQLAYRLRKPLAPYFQSPGALLDLGRGTAMPTAGHDGAAVQDGARFFRTDLGFACYYDGTRWLTMHEYSVVPFSAPAGLDFAANDGTALVARLRTDDAPLFTRIAMTTRVLTTNSAVSYWTVLLVGYSITFGSSTTIVNYDTSADTVNAYTSHEGAPAVVQPADYTHIALSVTKAGATGTPGTLRVFPSCFYRLIIP